MDTPANSPPGTGTPRPKGRRKKLTPEERRARRVEKSLRWHEQHGFFSIRHWGLYTVPFTRSVKRLGESVAGFRALVAHVERWLCPPRQSSVVRCPLSVVSSPLSVASTPLPVAGESSSVASGQSAAASSELRTTNDELRAEPRAEDQERSATDNGQRTTDSSLLLMVARKVARALAQVLWLGPRVMRERARERAIHLEARLRLMAELQSVLRGQHGAEAEAKLRATLQQAHGPELGEYRLMKIYGFDPGAVWPRRFARHMAEMVVDAVDNQLDLQRDLKVIRRRMNWLLEVYQFAASLVGSRWQVVGGAAVPAPAASATPSPPAPPPAPLPQGGEGRSNWQFREACGSVASGSVASPSSAGGPEAAAGRPPASEPAPLNSHFVPPSPPSHLVLPSPPWGRGAGGEGVADADTAPATGHRQPAADHQQSARASLDREAARLNALLIEVYEALAKGDGDPGAPTPAERSAVRARLKQLHAEEKRLDAERRKFDMLDKVQANPVESLGNPHLRPSKVKRQLSGRVRKRRPKAEPDPVVAERMLQHKLDMDAYMVAIRTEQERQHHADRERWFAAEAGITVEELRRRKAETPDPVGVRRVWHPLAGWYAEVKTWHGRWLQTIREYVAPGSADWWPEARELKLRAEITARHEAARHRATEPEGNAAGQEDGAAKQEAGAVPAPLLGYEEIKRLVAEAFGIERSQKPGVRSQKRRRATVSSNGQSQISNFKLPTEPRTTTDESRTTDSGLRTTDSGQQEATCKNKSKSKRQKSKSTAGPSRTARATSEPGTANNEPRTTDNEPRTTDRPRRNRKSQISNRKLRIGNRQSKIGNGRAVVISNGKGQMSNFKLPSEPRTTNHGPRTTDNGPRTTDRPRRNRQSQITNRKLRIGNSAVRVARLLWVIVERDARRAHREASRVDLLLAGARFGEPEPVRTECGCFERQDRKAGFAQRERLARLAEAFWRLLVAIHGETTDFERMWIEKARQMGPQARRQPTDFERLRPHRSWFDPERMRMMRVALEIDPPADNLESEIDASGDFESEIGVSEDFVTAAQASASDSGGSADSDTAEDSTGAKDFEGREGFERATECGSSRDSGPEQDSRPSGDSGPAEEPERLKESEPAGEPESDRESGSAQEHEPHRESGRTEDFEGAESSAPGGDSERDSDSAARSRKWRSSRSFGRWLDKVCEQWEKDNLEEST